MNEVGAVPTRVTTADVIAGVSVALILIPQSLAYAGIAGMPAHVGLYAAALPLIVFAIFASSPYLQTGPVAMTALLSFGALSAIATPFTAEYIALAALLAIVVGVFRAVFGAVRLGVVVYFMSRPVLVGFTTGAAILIISSQLPAALGSTPPEGKLLERAWWAISHPASWELGAIALSLVTIAIVVITGRISPLVPGVLIAVVGALIASTAFGYDGNVVGEIPSGAPPFSLDLPWDQLGSLIIPGLVIALIGFAEPAAIARIFAAQERQRWNPDREFFASGAANVASGISGGFPIGGSFSRSSVNRLAGARTRWSGGITGLAVLLFLPIAGVLEPLPIAVLAAIVITAVVRLIRPGDIVAIYRRSRLQAGIAVITLVATLVLAPRIDIAVVIGVGLAVAVHLIRELKVDVAFEYADETLRLAPSGVMFFASTPGLADALVDHLADHPETTRLVIDLGGVGRIDYTGAEALRALVDDARAAGLEVECVAVPPHAQRMVEGMLSVDGPPETDEER
jgi:SulP family sulfate permease